MVRALGIKAVSSYLPDEPDTVVRPDLQRGARLFDDDLKRITAAGGVRCGLNPPTSSEGRGRTKPLPGLEYDRDSQRGYPDQNEIEP